MKLRRFLRQEMQIFSLYTKYAKGLSLVFFIALLSFFASKISFISALHISALLIAILLGVVLSGFYAKYKKSLEQGVSFSAKKLLRFGIILYGFNVSLLDIANVGFLGVLAACVIVVLVLIFGVILGVKVLKMDKELSILISAGSAICGAAAILALESALKSSNDKSIIALAMVVLFGLLSMVLYPLLYFSQVLPFDAQQMGLFIGLALHEVANVVGAGAAISEESATYALIVKMIRVILLVPVLLLVPLLFSQSKSGGKRKLEIPYFALAFLAVIIFHSFVILPEWLLNFFQVLCVLSLSSAMASLGLGIHFKSFANSGKNAFKLAFLLFILLFVLGFLLVYMIS